MRLTVNSAICKLSMHPVTMLSGMIKTTLRNCCIVWLVLDIVQTMKIRQMLESAVPKKAPKKTARALPPVSPSLQLAALSRRHPRRRAALARSEAPPAGAPRGDEPRGDSGGTEGTSGARKVPGQSPLTSPLAAV